MFWLQPCGSRLGASFQLIQLLGDGLLLPHVSVALALEYEEVLKRPGMIPSLNSADIDRFLDFILRSSNLLPSVVANRPGLTDPDDELVLDLALQCGAAIITIKETSLRLCGRVLLS